METEIIRILREEVLDHNGDIHPETDLFAIGLDSMAIMQLQLALEEHFGITIDPADLSKKNFQSPAAVASLTRSKQKP